MVVARAGMAVVLAVRAVVVVEAQGEVSLTVERAIRIARSSLSTAWSAQTTTVRCVLDSVRNRHHLRRRWQSGLGRRIRLGRLLRSSSVAHRRVLGPLCMIPPLCISRGQGWGKLSPPFRSSSCPAQHTGTGAAHQPAADGSGTSTRRPACQTQWVGERRARDPTGPHHQSRHLHSDNLGEEALGAAPAEKAGQGLRCRGLERASRGTKAA